MGLPDLFKYSQLKILRLPKKSGWLLYKPLPGLGQVVGILGFISPDNAG